MQWWCAARDVAWSWTWRPYPGVWLFIATVLVLHAWATRRARSAAPGPTRLQNLCFGAGVALLWAALDWPIGALGAGYLASVHMVQFLLLAMAVPPLLLLGWPVARRGARSVWFRRLTHPLLTLLLFTAIVIATHLPVANDTLMRWQLGSFLVDMLWLGGGLLYWWPVLRETERPYFSAPLRMAYLFSSMVAMTAPGAMITFSDFPIYGVYELAPPVHDIARVDDQRLAGLLMKVGGGFVVWVAISILFYRWSREEERLLGFPARTGRG
jgi:putative membrane protein